MDTLFEMSYESARDAGSLPVSLPALFHRNRRHASRLIAPTHGAGNGQVGAFMFGINSGTTMPVSPCSAGGGATNPGV